MLHYRLATTMWEYLRHEVLKISNDGRMQDQGHFSLKWHDEPPAQTAMLRIRKTDRKLLVIACLQSLVNEPHALL